MPNEPFPQSIADLPAQRARSPNSKAEARARYFNTGNAFNLQLPRVPDETGVHQERQPGQRQHPAPSRLLVGDVVGGARLAPQRLQPRLREQVI